MKIVCKLPEWTELKCKTYSNTECQFPFKFKGQTFHECTNQVIGIKDCAEYGCDDEDSLELGSGDFWFDEESRELGIGDFWCATETSEDGTMVKGKWAKCDLDSCTESTPSTESTANTESTSRTSSTTSTESIASKESTENTERNWCDYFNLWGLICS